MNSLDNLGDELADLDLSGLEEETAPAVAPAVPEASSAQSMQFFKHIPVEVTVEVAQKSVPLAELMNISANSVLMLDKQEGEPVDIKVNGKLFGHGEIVEQDNKYGVKIIHVINPLDE